MCRWGRPLVILAPSTGVVEQTDRSPWPPKFLAHRICEWQNDVLGECSKIKDSLLDMYNYRYEPRQKTLQLNWEWNMHLRPIWGFGNSQQLVLDITVESYVNEAMAVNAPSMMSGNKEQDGLLCQKDTRTHFWVIILCDQLVSIFKFNVSKL